MKNIICEKDYLSDSINQRNIYELINKKTRCAQICVEFIPEGFPQKHIYKYTFELKIDDYNKVYIAAEKFSEKKGYNSNNNYFTVFESKNGELINYADIKKLDKYKEKTQNLLKVSSFSSFILDLMKDLQDEISKANVENIVTWQSVLGIPQLFIFALTSQVYIDNADDHRNYVNQILHDEIGGKESDPLSIVYSAQSIIRSRTHKYGFNIVNKNMFSAFVDSVKRMSGFIKLFKSDLIDIEIDKKAPGRMSSFT